MFGLQFRSWSNSEISVIPRLGCVVKVSATTVSERNTVDVGETHPYCLCLVMGMFGCLLKNSGATTLALFCRQMEGEDKRCSKRTLVKAFRSNMPRKEYGG
ncbi:unnamed protein product [Choristocarpus tenellus]